MCISSDQWDKKKHWTNWNKTRHTNLGSWNIQHITKVSSYYILILLLVNDFYLTYLKKKIHYFIFLSFVLMHPTSPFRQLFADQCPPGDADLWSLSALVVSVEAVERPLFIPLEEAELCIAGTWLMLRDPCSGWLLYPDAGAASVISLD